MAWKFADWSAEQRTEVPNTAGGVARELNALLQLRHNSRVGSIEGNLEVSMNLRTNLTGCLLPQPWQWFASGRSPAPPCKGTFYLSVKE